MASEHKDEKARPFYVRLYEHLATKNFANQGDIVNALEEFKLSNITANKQKYYERVDSDNLDPKVIPFGKHKGKQLVDVLQSDRPYLVWLIKQKWMDRFAGLANELATHGITKQQKASAKQAPEEQQDEPQDEVAKLRAQLKALEKKA